MILFGFILKKREIFYGCISDAHWYKHGDKQSKRVQYSGEAKLLFCEEIWLNYDQIDETDKDSQVSGNCIFNTLSAYYAHKQLLKYCAICFFLLRKLFTFKKKMNTMKSTITLLLFILLNSNLSAQFAWSQKNNFPASRCGTSYFTIGNKAYVGSGYNGTGHNEWWEYDYINDTWAQKANYPIPSLWSASCFSINNKGYVICGTNSSYTLSFYEYDPSLDTWTQKANFPGGARQDASFFSLNGYGYVTCGYGGVYRDDLWQYDQNTDTWTQKTSFPGSSRTGTVSFVLNNNAYVGLGVSNGIVYSDFYCYNGTNDSWVQVANFPGAARNSCSTFTYNGLGFCGLGYDNATTYYSDFYTYNDSTNVWNQTLNYPGPETSYTFSFSLGNSAYVGTGKGPGSAYRNEVYKLSRINDGISENTKSDFSATVIYGNNSPSIKINSAINEKIHFVIYDAAGQLIYKSDFNSTHIINVNDILTLSAGTYIFKISNKSRSYTDKLIIY